jgi:hypothetical protein
MSIRQPEDARQQEERRRPREAGEDVVGPHGRRVKAGKCRSGLRLEYPEPENAPRALCDRKSQKSANPKTKIKGKSRGQKLNASAAIK